MNDDRRERSRGVGWAMAVSLAAAVGFYVCRHWELAAAPLAELAEVLLR